MEEIDKVPKEPRATVKTVGGADRIAARLKAEIAGSTGVGPPLTPLPAGAIVVAEPPERQPVGASGRSAYRRARARRLSPAEREAVRALAPNRSLRELATDFGVSHETVRAVLRERGGLTGR